MRSKILLGVLLVGGLIGAVQLINFSRTQGRPVDFPDGMHWMCISCDHGFSIPREEFAAWAAENDERYPCPECGEQKTDVAQRCPHRKCGAYHVTPNAVIDGKVCCPVCKEPLP